MDPQFSFTSPPSVVTSVDSNKTSFSFLYPPTKANTSTEIGFTTVSQKKRKLDDDDSLGNGSGKRYHAHVGFLSPVVNNSAVRPSPEAISSTIANTPAVIRTAPVTANLVNFMTPVLKRTKQPATSSNSQTLVSLNNTTDTAKRILHSFDKFATPLERSSVANPAPLLSRTGYLRTPIRRNKPVALSTGLSLLPNTSKTVSIAQEAAINATTATTTTTTPAASAFATPVPAKDVDAPVTSSFAFGGSDKLPKVDSAATAAVVTETPTVDSVKANFHFFSKSTEPTPFEPVTIVQPAKSVSFAPPQKKVIEQEEEEEEDEVNCDDCGMGKEVDHSACDVRPTGETTKQSKNMTIPAFGFGQSSTTTTTTTETKAPSFSFGSTSSSSDTKATAAPSFSFGSTNAPTTTTTPSFSFGASTTTSDGATKSTITPCFSFGSSKNTTSTAETTNSKRKSHDAQCNDCGMSKEVDHSSCDVKPNKKQLSEAKTPTFSFGSAATITNTSTTTAPTFAFGGVDTTSSKPDSLANLKKIVADEEEEEEESLCSDCGMGKEVDHSSCDVAPTKAATAVKSTAASTSSAPTFSFGATSTFGSTSATMPATTNALNFKKIVPDDDEEEAEILCADCGMGKEVDHSACDVVPAKGTTTTINATTTSTTPSLGFGMVPATSTYSTSNAPSFSFGSSKTTSDTTTTSTAPSFSFGATSNGSTSFSFGGAEKPAVTDKPASTSFAFGTSSVTAAASATDSKSAVPSFAFGTSSATTAASATDSKSAVPSFAFGATNTETKAAPFSFGGGSNAEASPFNFGSATDVKPDVPKSTAGFAFGVTNADTKPASSFGFGGAPSAFSASTTEAKPANSFSFGTSASSADSVSLGFPYANTTSSTPPVSTPFSTSSAFGSNNNSFGAPSMPVTSFGATPGPASNSFGPPSNSFGPSSNSFGPPSNSFGPPASSNPFGNQASPPNQFHAPSSGFSMGATSAPAGIPGRKIAMRKR